MLGGLAGGQIRLLLTSIEVVFVHDEVVGRSSPNLRLLLLLCGRGHDEGRRGQQGPELLLHATVLAAATAPLLLLLEQLGQSLEKKSGITLLFRSVN